MNPRDITNLKIKKINNPITEDEAKQIYDSLYLVIQSIAANSFFMAYEMRNKIMTTFTECETNINELRNSEQKKSIELRDYEFVLKNASAVCFIVEKTIKEDFGRTILRKSEGFPDYIPGWKIKDKRRERND